MKISLLSVGNKPPSWVTEGCMAYITRMPKEWAFSLVEIKPEKRGEKSRDVLLAAEKQRFLPYLTKMRRTLVLDERGKHITTRQLALLLEDFQQIGGDTAFLIGGSEGIDAHLKQKADHLICLSAFTLPHALARLVLCEQLYRAAMVIKNHPYHREG